MPAVSSVLVIGGGAAGTATAILLAERGVAVDLVEQLALAGHPGNRQQAQRSQGNKQQYDQQECAEKFRVDGDLEPRDPAHQQPQWRAGQEAVCYFSTEARR